MAPQSLSLSDVEVEKTPSLSAADVEIEGANDQASADVSANDQRQQRPPMTTGQSDKEILAATKTPSGFKVDERPTPRRPISLDIGKPPGAATTPPTTPELQLGERVEQRHGAPLAPTLEGGVSDFQAKPKEFSRITTSPEVIPPHQQFEPTPAQLPSIAEPEKQGLNVPQAGIESWGGTVPSMTGGAPPGGIKPEEAAQMAKTTWQATGGKIGRGAQELYESGALSNPLGYQTPPPTKPVHVDTEKTMGGVADILSGVGTTILPLAVAGAVAAPIPTAVGLAGAWAGSSGAEYLAKKAGLSPEAQRMIGELGGWAGAFAGGFAGHKFSKVFEPKETGLATAADTARQEAVDQHLDNFREIIKAAGIDLPEDPTFSEAKRAYAQAQRFYHPDTSNATGSPEKFASSAQQVGKLSELWDKLSKAGVFPKETKPATAQGMADQVRSALDETVVKIHEAAEEAQGRTVEKPAKETPATVAPATQEPAAPTGAVPETVQPTDIHAQGVQQQPETVKAAEGIAAQVPGAKVVDPGAKPVDSIEEKAADGRPITDASRAQIVVPDDAAKQQAVQAIGEQLPAQEIQPIEAKNLPIVAAKLPNKQEIQVATEEEAKTQRETHDLYAGIREAKADGDKAEADKLQAELDAKLAAAPSAPAAALPKDLSGSKPRYGYGARNYELEFEDPRDLASYTVTQATPNKAHDRFMSWLRGQYPGESDAQIVQRGKDVRARIKALAKNANDEPYDAITVPGTEPTTTEGAPALTSADVEKQEAPIVKGSKVIVRTKDAATAGEVVYVPKQPFEKYRIKPSGTGKPIELSPREFKEQVSLQPEYAKPEAQPVKWQKADIVPTRGGVQAIPHAPETPAQAAKETAPGLVVGQQYLVEGRPAKFIGERKSSSAASGRANWFSRPEKTGNAYKDADFGIPTGKQTDKQVSNLETPAQAATETAPGQGVAVTAATTNPVPKEGAIAFDFDNTLQDEKTGQPIQATVDLAKREIASGKDVWIHSSKITGHPERAAEIKAWTKEHLGKELPVTNVKYEQFAEFYDDKNKPLPGQGEATKPEPLRYTGAYGQGIEVGVGDRVQYRGEDDWKITHVDVEGQMVNIANQTESLWGVDVGDVDLIRQGMNRGGDEEASDEFDSYEDLKDNVREGDTIYWNTGPAQEMSGTVESFDDDDRSVDAKLNDETIPGHAPIKPLTDILKGRITSTVAWELVRTKPMSGVIQGEKGAVSRDEDIKGQLPAAEPEHKFKFGSTQANISRRSNAGLAIQTARDRISDSDLMGKGKDADEALHVTVRYGIKGDSDINGIRDHLSQQQPFEAKLGKTTSFPPSEHSDGAAVIVAPIESADLHRLNAELEQHGEFTEPSFDQYKPHVTIAYVKPDKAARYTGMSVTEGKTFTIDTIGITDRDGNMEVVKLGGTPASALKAKIAKAKGETNASQGSNAPVQKTPTAQREPEGAASNQPAPGKGDTDVIRAQGGGEHPATAEQQGFTIGGFINTKPRPQGAERPPAEDEGKGGAGVLIAGKFKKGQLVVAEGKVGTVWADASLYSRPVWPPNAPRQLTLAQVEVRLQQGGVITVPVNQVMPAGTPEAEAAKKPTITPQVPPPKAAGPFQSYKVMVREAGGKGFTSNAQRYATKEEADTAGRDLMSRWMGAAEFKVEPDEEAPNVKPIDTGSKIKPSGTEETSTAGAVGKAEGVPSLPTPESAGGNAPAPVPTGRVEEPKGERPVRQGARPEGGEHLERPSGRPSGGAQPERGGGTGVTEHAAPEREGADGRPVTAPTPEEPDEAVKTTAELRNKNNYRISDEEAAQIGTGGEITKIKGNLDALETLKKIQSEGRELATPDEQATLAKYVDFGGLVGMLQNYGKPEYAAHYKRFQSILSNAEIQEIRETLPNTHYTSMQMVDWMWKAMQRMGFKGGRLLEPGMGIGNFMGRIPKKISDRAELYGVERNPLTGSMAKLLYPDAKIVVKPFQQFQVPDNTLDAIIGNVPFQDVTITNDPQYKKLGLNLHNYFIVKSLDKLRPGGIAALITSRYTMDSTKGTGIRAREEMAKRADLLAAIRLPDAAFKRTAGTEVVADLLIFRKRAPGDILEKMPEWTQTTEITVPGKRIEGTYGPRTIPDKTFFINKYFEKNPENVLGTHSQEGSMYGPGQYTVKGPEDFQGALDKALESIPRSVYGKLKGQKVAAPATTEVQPEGINFAPEDVKPGAFYRDENGNIKIKESGVGVDLPPELRTRDVIDHIKAAIDLRDQLNRTIEAQLTNEDDAPVKVEQAKLDKLYDKYHSKYGDLHGPLLKKAFGQDPEYPKLLALENRDTETATISKAAIFTKRILAPPDPLRELPTDPKSAMLKVLAARGYLDTKFMADLLKVPEQDVVDKLESNGLIFQDPQTGKYHTADEYLSGDVREKLRVATNAADTEPKYKANVEALAKVQPKDLTIHEIQPNIGATWIPMSIYRAFVAHLMGSAARDVDITRSLDGKWLVQAQRTRNNWEGGGISAHKLVQSALNQQMPTVWEKDSDGHRYVNQPATVAAREKLSAIKEEFRTVLRKAPDETVKKLEDTYNQTFNSIKQREFDGGHLDFPGMSEEWRDKIRGYQKAFVWRILQEGRGGLFHAVGLGKTLTMISAGQEAIRLKLSPKNLYAVPNHMVPQWREDFKRFYPTANVLAVTDEDFSPVNRNKLMSRIATGDWDAVILPHSQFDLLPMSPEFESNTIEKRLADYRRVLEELDPQEDKRTIKQIEKAIDKLESRLHTLADKKKDNTITYDKMGFGMAFIDEAHGYKAMAVPTKMGNIKGLSNRASQKAFALEMKADFMRDAHKGRGIVFATGTPLTNTIGELYVMTKYLAPELLEEAGIRSFDDWAAQFANPVTEWEYAADGVTFRPSTALAEFVNVPELSKMFQRFAEYLSKDAAVKLANIQLPEPSRKDVMVTVTPSQEPLLWNIAERGQSLFDNPPRTKEERQADNWLKLSSDARKISLDPRLYDPSLPDDPGSKINKAATEIVNALKETDQHKGAVAVFSDFFAHHDEISGKVDFNLFDDLRDKLVKAGIPRNQIAIIHEAGDNKDAKEAMFAKVRSGKIRVIMGSTDKMGIGTNIQDRLYALLHLDQPWRPDQVEQREGREIRSGNMFAQPEYGGKVKVFRFISEPEEGKVMRWDTKKGEEVEKDRPRAYDLQMYQQLERKANWQEQFLTGNYTGRTMEDTGGDVKLNSQMFALGKAMSTGNPDAIRKMKVEHELRTMNLLERNFQTERSKNVRNLSYAEQKLPVLRQGLVEVGKNIEAWEKATAPAKAALEAAQKEFNEYYDSLPVGERKTDPKVKALEEKRHELAQETGAPIQIGDELLDTKDKRAAFVKANPEVKALEGREITIGGIKTEIRESAHRAKYEYRLVKRSSNWHYVPENDEGPERTAAFFASFAAAMRNANSDQISMAEQIEYNEKEIASLSKLLKDPDPYIAKVEKMEAELKEIDIRLGRVDPKITAHPEDEGAAMEEDDDGTPEASGKPETADEDNATLRASVFGLDIAAKALYRFAKLADAHYDSGIDALLQKTHLGRAFPEVEAHDAQVARDLRELAAAPQYYRAKAEANMRKVVGGLTPEQEKGFMLMSDQAERDWLRDAHPDEYRQYLRDPAIQHALDVYKPLEDESREDARALGVQVIEDDYMRRVYTEHVAGIGQKTAKGEKVSPSSYDRVITPQMGNKKGRTASPEYYYEKGLHEFGPAYATRYMANKLKLAEHRAAVHFLNKATRIDPKDGLPESIMYNGNRYFRPDVARLIKEATPDSPEGAAIAADLNLNLPMSQQITQLPKPSKVQEFSVYDPTPPDKSDYQAKNLADLVQKAAQNASGLKLREADMDELIARAAALTYSAHPLFAGPKEIVEAFQKGANHVIPQWSKDAQAVIGPITGMVRRQFIGLGMGIPHIKNILRRVIQTSPGAHLDPRSWARAVKILFSEELRQRGLAGVDDPSFDALLRHAGISDKGIESYHDYLDSNLDGNKLERGWNLLKAAVPDEKAFIKEMAAEIRAHWREGGIVGKAAAVTQTAAAIVEAPLRPFMRIGHHIIFSKGGIDQRARIWLYDLIKSQEPGISADEIAQEVNAQLGRYNKASWTDMQKDWQFATFFPGWSYSTVEWILRHPLKTTIAGMLLTLLANQVLNHYRKNNRKESFDVSRVHFGKYSISDNLFRERLGMAEMGMPARMATALMEGKRGEPAVRDALLGVGSDARAFVGELNPILATPFEIGMGKELGTGRDIVPQGDKKKSGKVEKDWMYYASRKLFPVYAQTAEPQQGQTRAESLSHNLGVNVYEEKRRK